MVNLGAMKLNWRARGFSCDTWTDPPGQVWEDYTHSVDELVMVIEGVVELEIDGKVLRPAIGEEVLISAGALHSVRNRSNTTSRWLYGYKMSNSP
jgi:quercetin dioxygenase-like cupin family protein